MGAGVFGALVGGDGEIVAADSVPVGDVALVDVLDLEGGEVFDGVVLADEEDEAFVGDWGDLEFDAGGGGCGDFGF